MGTNNGGGVKARKFYNSMMVAASFNDWERLRRIANKTLELAEQGESWAVQMVRDTLDGKPSQQVTLASDPDNPLLIALDSAAQLDKKLR